MTRMRLVAGMATVGFLAMAASSGTAWAGGPPGAVENASEAVGTGEFTGNLVGFRATGATNDEASANVIAACQRAGGVECTSDEVTNEDVCIVAVADDASDVVAGGSGPTVEEARQDALRSAARNDSPLPPNATVVISACP